MPTYCLKNSPMVAMKKAPPTMASRDFPPNRLMSWPVNNPRRKMERSEIKRPAKIRSPKRD